MATTYLTQDQLDPTLKANDIVLIDFYADWCGPCKMFAPIFEKASEKHEDIKFMKVDTEKEQELAAAFGVRSIPTLAVFRENILIFMQPGALPEPAFEQLLEQVKSLDMDEVRAKIAAEEGAEKN